VTANAEQRAMVGDPTTPSTTLHELAAAEPELWPAIAAHPNVYPDLLTWMYENGLPRPQASPPETAAQQAVSAADAPIPSAPVPSGTAAIEPRRLGRAAKAIIWSAAGVIAAGIAAVLVVTLIVIPQQQAAAEAAAAARAAHDRAVADFKASASLCQDANSAYATSLDAARTALKIDPTTLADPSLFDALQSTIDQNKGEARCISPTMASETAQIEAQISEMDAAHAGLSTAASRLSDSTRAVTASVDRKLAQDALDARTLEGTWTDGDGYSFIVSVALPDASWTPVKTTVDITGARPGQALIRIETRAELELTVTNTTPAREARWRAPLDLMPVWSSELDLCSLQAISAYDADDRYRIMTPVTRLETPFCVGLLDCDWGYSGAGVPQQTIPVDGTVTYPVSCGGAGVINVPEADAERIASILATPPTDWLFGITGLANYDPNYFCERLLDQSVPLLCR